KVYRIEDDGTKTDMNAVYEDGYMVFTTDHFSMYALVSESESKGALIGDANGDGMITIADVTTVQKVAVKLTTLTEEQNTLADVNGDGRISVLDATCIQKYIVGGYSDTGLTGQRVEG
ncbi:MAG: dockerin type I repeat-containing protein, partial [Clostridiales bacterium]|nr:dockerin type I repeat-containing protein [Clostridiales bacterium]